MIAGRFSDNGELFFEIELIAANGESFTVEAVPVHVGDELSDILMGCQWLENFELIVNKKKEILTLKIMESE